MRMSSTRVDLPLPDGPVTQVKLPSGKAAVTFLRLCAVAPWMLMEFSVLGERFAVKSV
jgi:hypothetical protein